MDEPSEETGYEFQRRLKQFLDGCPDLSAGHRQRLSRPLRQADVRCWGAAESSLGEAIKVSMRVAAHELLELYCLQIESAFARCPATVQKALLAAIVAQAMPTGARVLFRIDGALRGLSWPAIETLTIEPQASLAGRQVDFLLDWEHLDSTEPNAFRNRLAVQCGQPHALDAGEVRVMLLAGEEVQANPFACAARILAELSRR